MSDQERKQFDEWRERFINETGFPPNESDAWQARAALAQQAVPDGWKLVPVEPTDAMRIAGGIAHESSPAHDVIGPLVDAWAAMLAAAPAAPQTEKRAGQAPAPGADSTEGLRQLLAVANEGDSARWEIGFRNIVAILYGPRHKFEIADVVERIREIASPAVGDRWQPIETAPTDGTTVLTFRMLNGEPQIADARYFEATGCWGQRSWRYPDSMGPTHWMPLPTAPDSNVPVQPMGGSNV